MENPFLEINDKLERLEYLIIQMINKDNSSSSASQKQILNIKEASLLLNEAVPTIYGRTSRREIPFYKKGKKLYFKKDELVKWIEEGKQKTLKEIQDEVMVTPGRRSIRR